MNYRGKTKQTPLNNCRKCGMDAGARKMTADGEKHAVVCEACGFKTRLYTTQGAATAEWNGKTRKGDA